MWYPICSINREISEKTGRLNYSHTMVLSKLKAELSSFYARGNSSYIRLIPTYFTYFWSCFKHLQVNKEHENSFKDSEYLFNLNPPQPPPPPSVELLIVFHFWHQSRFLWLLENGEQEKLQLLSSAFIWVEHVFISSVHQNFYHIYILHRASISVSFFASPVSENILSYVFFFQCPYPSSDSCLSITFSCRYIDLYLMCFGFFSGNVSLWVLSIQQCRANLQYCHTVPKGIMPSYHNYNKPKHSARVKLPPTRSNLQLFCFHMFLILTSCRNINPGEQLWKAVCDAQNQPALHVA